MSAAWSGEADLVALVGEWQRLALLAQGPGADTNTRVRCRREARALGRFLVRWVRANGAVGSAWRLCQALETVLGQQREQWMRGKASG